MKYIRFFFPQAKLYSDSEPVAAKAEAVVLLKQLDYPVGPEHFHSSLLIAVLQLMAYGKDVSQFFMKPLQPCKLFSYILWYGIIGGKVLDWRPIVSKL